MNKVKGVISGIEVSGSLSLVSVHCGNRVLKSIIIDTPDTLGYLVQGADVELLFKETEVVIAKPGPLDISLQNRIPATVFSISKGELLSSLILNSELGKLESIISTAAVTQLKLEPGKVVQAMVKLNEMMLSPC
ncbi:TOBE domain-containing protein [Zeaxanthinibacter sp. PT1]|uniref:TOBE domain-containing protein n=1 Tax=Zeaxanthinibacter TaxID=561554 RepID=UPI002349EF59|nr:TOBE domain-containing protein [Zeaxanthinibacter sp. PT1]MDC6351992.1 TOBE domain-containing protein [Zeaxanthinibacter sp. PT1]